MAKKSEKASGEAAGGGTPEKPPAFEAALAELEEIVQQLEAGEKSLDESLKLYERGVAALRTCHQLLDQAEQRIRKLVAGPGGEPVVQDLKLSPTRGAAEEGEALSTEEAGAPGTEGGKEPADALEKKPRPGGRSRVQRAQNPGEASARDEGTPRKGGSLFGGA